MNTIGWQPGVTLAMVEREIILKAYNYFEKNKTRTADSLGIAVRTLDAKLAQYEGKKDEKASVHTEGRNAVEPVAQVPAQSPMSMHERQEVQKVSSAKHAKGSAKKIGA